MGTAKKAKYPIGFYICCITYTFERFAFLWYKTAFSLIPCCICSSKAVSE